MMKDMRKRRILIIGGTGYLGQHLLQGFTDNHQEETSPSSSSSSYSLAFTYHSSQPPQILLDLGVPFHLDLRTGDGFDAISQKFGQPDVVINCAALSIPRDCEADPESAMSINVPSAVVEWMSNFDNNNKALLVHLSTDQVYEGTKSFYKEEDETAPVNVYGKSKVLAEQFITAKCSNFAILRSSIIFGPQTISPVPKSLPIQWIDGVLKKSEETQFFFDEYRCPIYVKDLVAIIQALITKWFSEGKTMQILLNVGGPNRISRVEMAETVAHVRGYNTSLIKPVSASSVDRGVKSPSDISMDISKLSDVVGISPVTFRDGVRLTLGC